MKFINNPKILLTFLLLFIANTLNAQISSIKSQILELYWYLPANSEKFDLRSKLHSSNNFTKVEDSNPKYGIDAISSNFENNKQLESLGIENKLYIYFDKNSFPDQWVITSSYTPDNFNRCQLQFNQILTYFNKVSFKSNESIINDASDKLIGRGFWFYSSQNMLNQRKPYATINYSYSNFKNQYELSIHYYPNAMK